MIPSHFSGNRNVNSVIGSILNVLQLGVYKKSIETWFCGIVYLLALSPIFFHSTTISVFLGIFKKFKIVLDF